MLKVNSKNTRTNFQINFEHILHFCSSATIVNFKQVNAGWDY